MKVAGLLQVLAGDHRHHALHGQSLAGVDIEYFGVGVGTAHDVHVEHAWQLDVVDVAALALDEAGVLLALHPVPHAPNLGRRGDSDLRRGLDRRRAALWSRGVFLESIVQLSRHAVSSAVLASGSARISAAAH